MIAKNYQRFPTLPEALEYAQGLGATYYAVFTRPQGRPTCLVYRRCPNGFRQWQKARLENTHHVDGTFYWTVSRAWIDVRRGPLLVNAKPITEMPEEEVEGG